MKTLDRFTAKKFLRNLVVVSAFFNVTYIFMDFVGRYSTFARHKAPAGLILYYYMLKLPESLHYTLPFSTLIASIITFSLLKRNNEIMVLRACGTSLKRIIAAPFFVAVLVAVAGSLNGAKLTKFMSMSKEIYSHRIQKERGSSLVGKEGIWIKEGKNFLYLQGETPEGFRKIILIVMDKSFKPKRRVEGGPVTIKGRRLLISKGLEYIFSGNSVTMKKLLNAHLKLPKKLDRSVETLLTMPKRGLSGIFLLSKRGYVPRFHRSFVIEKVSFALSTPIFFLIGVIVSLIAKTRARIGVEFGIALAIMSIYWITHSFFFYLGVGYRINPLLATNVSNILFLIPSVLILIRRGESW